VSKPAEVLVKGHTGRSLVLEAVGQRLLWGGDARAHVRVHSEKLHDDQTRLCVVQTACRRMPDMRTLLKPDTRWICCAACSSILLGNACMRKHMSSLAFGSRARSR
jgi:hypothetical protein